METTSYRVPEYNVPEINARIARMNRKASKLGLAPVGMNTVRIETIELVFPSGHPLEGIRTGRVNVYYHIEFTGVAPVISGHTFLARIEHTSAGNIVSKAPGISADLSAYYNVEPTCEHCNTTRRRNDTFVLRTPEGCLKQVGRNCLADYLRSTDVASAVSLFNLLDKVIRGMRDLDASEGGFGGCGFSGYATQSVLAATASIVHKEGWISSLTARMHDTQSTADRVRWYLNPPAQMRSLDLEEHRNLAPTAENVAESIKVIEWAKSLDGASDYENNLKVACSLPYVTDRNLALVVSAVTGYRRVVERELAEKAAKKANAGHFGDVGKRYDLDVTVKFTRSWDTQYGVSTLVAFEDAEGHIFKWKASGAVDVEAGERYHLRGTVKSHGDYKGILETTLSRCALKAIKDA